MAQRDEVPERGHLGQKILEEFAVELPQQRLELLTHMLDCASVEEHEVEDLRSFADILLPLGKSATRRLSLRAQVLEKAQEPTILDVSRLCLDQALHFLEVVEDLVGLLHVILVGCLKHALLALLIMEEPEFHLDVHRVLKLLDTLFHRAKVASEVVL